MTSTLCYISTAITGTHITAMYFDSVPRVGEVLIIAESEDSESRTTKYQIKDIVWRGVKWDNRRNLRVYKFPYTYIYVEEVGTGV